MNRRHKSLRSLRTQKKEFVEDLRLLQQKISGRSVYKRL